MKRPIKDSVYDREDRIRTYCFTPQLCDRAEKANRNQGQPCVPFMQIVQESLGKDFNPVDLISLDPEIRGRARNSVHFMTHIMCEENEGRITYNLENVSKNLPSNRVFTACGKTLNDFSNSIIILEQFFLDWLYLFNPVILMKLANIFQIKTNVICPYVIRI